MSCSQRRLPKLVCTSCCLYAHPDCLMVTPEHLDPLTNSVAMLSQSLRAVADEQKYIKVRERVASNSMMGFCRLFPPYLTSCLSQSKYEQPCSVVWTRRNSGERFQCHVACFWSQFYMLDPRCDVDLENLVPTKLFRTQAYSTLAKKSK